MDADPPIQLASDLERDFRLGPRLNEVGGHERITGRDQVGVGQPAVQRLCHVHLLLLGAAGESQLGARDPLAPSQGAGDHLILDAVGLVYGQRAEFTCQWLEGRPVPHRRFETVRTRCHVDAHASTAFMSS